VDSTARRGDERWTVMGRTHGSTRASLPRPGYPWVNAQHERGSELRNHKLSPVSTNPMTTTRTNPWKEILNY
jgi:hypothetical protein